MQTVKKECLIDKLGFKLNWNVYYKSTFIQSLNKSFTYHIIDNISHSGFYNKYMQKKIILSIDLLEYEVPLLTQLLTTTAYAVRERDFCSQRKATLKHLWP